MKNLVHQHPSIQGLAWHRTKYYSFFLPMDWHQFYWTDDRDGQLHGPDANDAATVFAVAIHDLQTIVTPDDLDILSEGFFEGIERLPGCKFESRNPRVVGKQIHLEAKYTFEEDGNTRKCWQQIVYHETRQIAFTAQGGTPEKYAYWLPWFFEAMMTKRVHSHMPDAP